MSSANFYAALPVTKVREAGFDILVSRMRISEYYIQAMFAGGGMAWADRAHMTCLVFNYAGRHLHFIDGADGGLFLAAKQFKERAAKLI